MVCLVALLHQTQGNDDEHCITLHTISLQEASCTFDLVLWIFYYIKDPQHKENHNLVQVFQVHENIICTLMMLSVQCTTYIVCLCLHLHSVPTPSCMFTPAEKYFLKRQKTNWMHCHSPPPTVTITSLLGWLLSELWNFSSFLFPFFQPHLMLIIIKCIHSSSCTLTFIPKQHRGIVRMNYVM